MRRDDFTFLHPLRVRWAEVDRQDVVFNANYFLYFDVAVAEYWRAIGIPYPEGYVDTYGTEQVDPLSIDPKSRQGKLLQALRDAIGEVMDDNQSQINAKGTGFKGFRQFKGFTVLPIPFTTCLHGFSSLKTTKAPADSSLAGSKRPDTSASRPMRARH